jgi:hypothetical protein
VALQTFTAGQVLTAAQVNALQTNDFNQTVATKVANYTLVVGDRGTRVVGNGTSITFTVDNNIFSAGDTIKLHNINSTALTIAAGAGVTINNAAGLTMVQWQEATLFATSASSFILFESTASSAQGLTLINTTSFSAVSSQSLNNVFTTNFDNYRILFRATHSSAANDVTFRLRASGTDNSTANYNLQLLTAVSTTITGSNSFNQTSVIFSRISNNDVGICSGDIFGPALAQRTSFINQINLDNGYRVHLGEHNVASAFDGFTLTVASGTMTGVVSVYGYNK